MASAEKVLAFSLSKLRVGSHFLYSSPSIIFLLKLYNVTYTSNLVCRQSHSIRSLNDNCCGHETGLELYHDLRMWGRRYISKIRMENVQFSCIHVLA